MTDKDEKIELAPDKIEIVEETELALQPDVEPPVVREVSESVGAATSDDASSSEGEAEYAVSAEPADLASSKHFSAPKSLPARAPRRATRHPWMKNPQVMLGAAIVVGGLAAVLVGNLVLWLLRPAPQPTPQRYGAIHHEDRPSHSPALSLCASAVNHSAHMSS